MPHISKFIFLVFSSLSIFNGFNHFILNRCIQEVRIGYVKIRRNFSQKLFKLEEIFHKNFSQKHDTLKMYHVFVKNFKIQDSINHIYVLVIHGDERRINCAKISIKNRIHEQTRATNVSSHFDSVIIQGGSDVQISPSFERSINRPKCSRRVVNSARRCMLQRYTGS